MVIIEDIEGAWPAVRLDSDIDELGLSRTLPGQVKMKKKFPEKYNFEGNEHNKETTITTGFFHRIPQKVGQD